MDSTPGRKALAETPSPDLLQCYCRSDSLYLAGQGRPAAATHLRSNSGGAARLQDRRLGLCQISLPEPGPSTQRNRGSRGECDFLIVDSRSVSWKQEQIRIKAQDK